MLRFLMFTVPLLVVAAPALAQEAAADTTAAPAAPVVAAPVKPKKVCRTSQVTGSRIAETQCYTAAQWADIDRTRQASANKLISDVVGSAGSAHFPGSDSGGADTRSLFGLGNPQ
jgi:hypothetical protein